jgi:hypothetical protein
VPDRARFKAFSVDVTVTEAERALVSAGTNVKIKWHTAPAESIVLQSPDLAMFEGNVLSVRGATTFPSLEMVKVCEAV